MRIGPYDVEIFSDGTFRLDGGAMFGVVPKVLWEKDKPADELNRVAMEMNCLLIRLLIPRLPRLRHGWPGCAGGPPNVRPSAPSTTAANPSMPTGLIINYDPS